MADMDCTDEHAKQQVDFEESIRAKIAVIKDAGYHVSCPLWMLKRRTPVTNRAWSATVEVRQTVLSAVRW